MRPLNLVGARRWLFLGSGLVVAASLVLLAIPPTLRPGIEFTSGTTTLMRFEQDVEQRELREIYAELGHAEARIQSTGENEFLIRTSELDVPEGSFEVAPAPAVPPVGPTPVSTLGTVRLGAAGVYVPDQTGAYPNAASSFPNGCHACELAIDTETGRTEIRRYVAVNDFGTIVNPTLVAGQVHGGTAQGIGQALCEDTIYDGDGQLLTGSFMDYCLPRADDLPSFSLVLNEVPSPAHPLGVKGCGESGTIVGPAAVMNAALDALAAVGVTDIDMPLTPQRVWHAMRAAARG